MIHLSKIHAKDLDVEDLASRLLNGKVGVKLGTQDSMESFRNGSISMQVYYHRPHTTVIIFDDITKTIAVHSVCTHWPDTYDPQIGKAIAVRIAAKKFLRGVRI
jgi:hypothetical protein